MNADFFVYFVLVNICKGYTMCNILHIFAELSVHACGIKYLNLLYITVYLGYLLFYRICN